MNKHRLLLQAIILAAIILAAFFLRTWQLHQIPPGLWYDEAYNGLDALWLAKTGRFAPFMVGNNGREALWHYLLLFSTSILGQTPFALRWVGAMAGVLTIPVMYRFALIVSAPFVPRAWGGEARRWFALAATGWLAVSWWHLHLSRAGFRPVLLPPVLMLSLFFFWQGWRLAHSHRASAAAFIRQALPKFALAGLFLGLSQYTYLSARLAPLIFGGLAGWWLWQAYRGNPARAQAARVADKSIGSPAAIKYLWPGLFATALIAGLTFLPLGLFLFEHPGAFSSRTGDVVFKPDSLGDALAHLLQGISLFVGAGHELYRHHLPGRAMLGWLEIPFFWIGVLSLFRPGYLRRPEMHLILAGLLVMWLPALLASPPVHSLRPIGLLPFFYLIVTVGLTRFALFLARLRPWAAQHGPAILPLAFAIFIVFNGLINSYDYFGRWAGQPQVYQEYNGPLVDLADYLLDLTQTVDVIIPFHLYVHPTTRYLLGQSFIEINDTPPPQSERPAVMVIVPDTFQLLYVGNIPESPALVLLTQDEAGQGRVYVSRLPQTAEQPEINRELASMQADAEPFQEKLGRTIALLLPLDSQRHSVIRDIFQPAPRHSVRINWADLARLDSYEVTPNPASPGQPITLNLYWRSLTDLTFDYRLFLQIVDSAGNPITQSEGRALQEDMYRWRPEGILPTQHTLWLGPETPPGAYLVRMGFFDQRTGERLPLHLGKWSDGHWTDAYINSEGPPLDQVQIALFYVAADGADPRSPATPLSANFAQAIELTGVRLPDIQDTEQQLPVTNLPITLYWQASQPTGKPYTVFLQLLDENNQVVRSRDHQPLNGLYPTNLWSPGEIIVDTFDLPLPETGLPPGAYRLISGFYDFETGRRLPLDSGADFVELSSFVVK